MTYEQIVTMMQTYYVNADASMTTGHYAFQCNVAGDGEGAFYIEIAEGKVNVQPYDYVDRNAALNTTAETLKAITEGKVSYSDAVNSSALTIDGDAEAAAILDSVKTAIAAKTAAVVETAASEEVEQAEEKTVEIAVSAAEKAAEASSVKTAEKAPAKTSEKKAPARKRAVSKAASNAKSGKNKKTAK